eukprot:snap_masked-scaffold_38-processed-gene-2.40-mRNA-1 protein AED:1.00 eAED:1.00 QI:0/-1/0/0/-1/1/1/0/71
MAANSDKSNQELKTIQTELEMLKAAKKTSEACKAILDYVAGQESNDPLLNHTSENPYLSAPNSGGGCCIIS